LSVFLYEKYETFLSKGIDSTDNNYFPLAYLNHKRQPIVQIKLKANANKKIRETIKSEWKNREKEDEMERERNYKGDFWLEGDRWR